MRWMYAAVDPEQPLSEVVELAENAEDLFEEEGIDYWFGWKRTLRAACEAAHVCPEEVAFRLLARDQRPTDWAHESLVSLFSDLDQHFDLRIEPALLRVRNSAALWQSDARAGCLSTVDTIERVLHAHVGMVRRTMSTVASAVDVGVLTDIDEQILRHLAMEHSILALRADDLRVEAARAEGTEFAAAARVLIRGIHQHIKIAFNFVIPRLVAATHRPAGYEPR